MTEKLKNWIIPLFFGTSVASMIIRCYHSTEMLKYNTLFFAYAFVCFLVFDLLRKTKKLSGVLYLAIFLGVMYLTLNATYPPPASLSFEKWFYGAQTADTQVPEYTFALLFGGGFFLISILYYFTQIIYRAFGTMLIMFFPLFIYAKRTDEINRWDFVIVLFFYVLVLVHNRQMKSDKSCVVIFNKDYVCSVGLFVVAVISALVIFPQPDVVSKQEKDQDYFNNMVSSNAPSNFSDTSNSTGSKLSNEILFYVHSDSPFYLRRQSYDFYDGERWTIDNDDPYINKIPKDNDEYSFNTTNFSYVNLFYEISKNCDINYPTPEEKISTKSNAKVNIKDNFNAYYLLLPLNTTEIEGSYYQKMCHGEYKPLEGNNYIFTKEYSFDYYNLNYYGKQFAKKLNFSAEDILEILDNFSDGLSQSDEVLQNRVEDIYFETEYVSTRFNDYSAVSQDVYELANKITANLYSPYEKAKALEGYFQEENFEYELNVFPDTVDEFLFDKKAGACGDFATAMTLMARAVGLNARYVEGFVVTEIDPEQDDTYIVREYHSHAYVEVYINGLGWVIFDPTVDGYLDYYNVQETVSFFEIIGQYRFEIIAVLVIAILIYLLRYKISEMLFLIKLKFSDNEKVVILCYNRLCLHLSRKLGVNLSAKTSQEIKDLFLKVGINICEFVEIFEKVCYGKKISDKSQRDFVYAEYKTSKLAISKLKINYENSCNLEKLML